MFNMELKLVRKRKTSTYTIGKLYLDGLYICDTLEPPENGAHPCIPESTYKVTLDVVSPKYSKKKHWFYRGIGFKMPRLLDVVGRSGILIHSGNSPHDTQGCILVGFNTVVGELRCSMQTFINLYRLLEHDRNNLNLTISTLLY